MLSETSAVFVDVVEQPTRVPKTTTTSNAKHSLSVFIFLLSYDISQSLFRRTTRPERLWTEYFHPPNAQTNGRVLWDRSLIPAANARLR
jgi:hypothetical protein